MTLSDLLSDAKDFIAAGGLKDGFHACGVPHMGIQQTSMNRKSTCAVIDPMIGLVLQGGKTAQFGTQQVRYDAGDLVVVGQTLPLMSSTLNATSDTPYLALYIELDMQLLRVVYGEMAGMSRGDAGPALEAGQADAEVIDALARLFRLRRDPVEEQMLGSAALREVYFRVLRSSHSTALHQSIQADSKANQIAKAIRHIRSEYRKTIKASDLATLSGMSASVFYETFKSVTANSPLQYQKDLRLTEAHRLLQSAALPISQVAHSVGYDSAAQFSREFSRKFGAPPRAFAAVTQEVT